MQIEVPDTGWRKGVPDNVYHLQWDACNASRLKDFALTPELCRYSIDHPKFDSDGDTESKVLGRATHCAVLEPDYFEDRYIVEPTLFDPRTQVVVNKNTLLYREARWLREYGLTEEHLLPPLRKGLSGEKLAAAKAERREAYEQIVYYCRVGDKKTVLTVKQYEVASRIRDRLLSQPSHARDLVENFNETESSCVAYDPKTNVLCKVRPDGVIMGEGLIADLKSTRSIQYDSLSRDIFTYGYYMSAPFYLDVCNWFESELKKRTGKAPTSNELIKDRKPVDWKHHVFLFFETSPPYQTVVYDLDPYDMDLGRDEYRRLLDAYAWCERKNHWPGLPTTTIPISIPEWARRLLEAR